MSDRARRVWRAAPATLAAVVVFTLLAAGAVLGLAYLIYRRDGVAVDPRRARPARAARPALRLALRPAPPVGRRRRGRRTCATRSRRAPSTGTTSPSSRRARTAWSSARTTARPRRGACRSRTSHARADGSPGRTPWRTSSSTWSSCATRRWRTSETGLRIRRARPDESRGCSPGSSGRRARSTWSTCSRRRSIPTRSRGHRALAPAAARPHRPGVRAGPGRRRRWATSPSPPSEVLHLGVVPHRTRLGYGSALLEFAAREIHDGGEPEAGLWVLVGTRAAGLLPQPRLDGDRRSAGPATTRRSLPSWA